MIIDIVVHDAGPKGKAVFALRSFREGEFMLRRRPGRVVSNRHVARLSADDRRHLAELDFGHRAVLLCARVAGGGIGSAAAPCEILNGGLVRVPHWRFARLLKFLTEPTGRLELPTGGLRNRCSTN